jgi:plasmid maintenance system antidote protein VapI
MSDEEITKVEMKPCHQGEFVREEPLDESGLPVARATEILSVRPATLPNSVDGHAAHSPEMVPVR